VEQSLRKEPVSLIATNKATTFVSSKANKNNISNGDVQQTALQNLQTRDYFEDAMELKLQQAITSLPDKQQLVFKMKYYEDLKYEEISAL
jgi:DNA-directed RNA polymerase specialized sigma24 family protein